MTKQYLDAARRIINDGKWIKNERTGVNCLTVINVDMEYDVSKGELPLVTSRDCTRVFKVAVAELLAYIKGCDNAAEFREIGTKTWDANANENAAWLANPNRKGEDDLGRIYGAVAKKTPIFGYDNNGELIITSTYDQFEKVYNDLKRGIDDRGEIINFWEPGSFGLGALRPCMYSHHFSILDGTLYLNSTQRSSDWPIGECVNMVQVYVLLAVMAQITGLKPGIGYHKSVNAHIYENQLELMRDEQLHRSHYHHPTLTINPKIETLEDLRTWVTVDDFVLSDYKCHDAIKYPFTV